MSGPTPAIPEPRQGSSDRPQVDERPVVVAVDGSESSVRALVWAFRYAVAHRLRVEALTTWPLHGPVFVREVAGHFCEPRWQAREIQAQAVSRALAAVERAPAYDLAVDNAELIDALVRAGARASLLVIGSDGPADPSEQRRHLTDRVREEVLTSLVVVGPDGPLEGATRKGAAQQRERQREQQPEQHGVR
jgi:hypothetical protein